MASSSKENPVENQMESVMQLMSKRMRGEVTSAEIEAAVSGILTTMGAPAASASATTAQNTNTNPPPPSQETNSSSHIQVDTGNYDGDQDDADADQDDADADQDAQLKKTPTKETIKPVASKKKNKSKKTTEEEDSYQDEIDRIPMGKVGAKMMTTFGDGPTPDTKAIEAALLGTRTTLQMAILDARAIRRQAKQTFEQARQTVVQRDKASVADAADPSMLYRALSGYDRLSLQPKCGFDMEQLTWLFPEEMRAYQRWNVMHSEYQKSAEEDEHNAANGGGPAAVVQESDTEENNTRDNDFDDTQALGGHLKERAAQFDARTERMKSEWYIQFAKVRQGSFLLKGLRHRKSKVEVEWEANRKSIRGRRAGWESMPASSVRFLHWVGFEPPTIHPPNEETTQALAFMGYDIMGKILEKAIFIRNLQRLQQNKKDYDETKVLWELKRGEQLTLQDIEKALADPDIKPAPLHSLDDSAQPPSQLYFGPGFEQRLELEMEELVAAEKNARITDEERRIRQNEADLFAKLAPPPVILDSLTYLMEQRKEGEREREKEEEEQEKEADEEEPTMKSPRKRSRVEG